MERSDEHYQIEAYGVVLKLPPEVQEEYGRILLMIAGAEGELSAQEWAYFEGRGRAMGASSEMIEKWRKFDWKKGDLAASVRAFNAKVGGPVYAFVYDAVKIARVDGYHVEERKALRVAAAAAGIPESAVTSIENLVESEEALRTLRIGLLFPQSTQYHGAATPA